MKFLFATLGSWHNLPISWWFKIHQPNPNWKKQILSIFYPLKRIPYLFKLRYATCRSEKQVLLNNCINLLSPKLADFINDHHHPKTIEIPKVTNPQVISPKKIAKSPRVWKFQSMVDGGIKGFQQHLWWVRILLPKVDPRHLAQTSNGTTHWWNCQ